MEAKGMQGPHTQKNKTPIAATGLTASSTKLKRAHAVAKCPVSPASLTSWGLWCHKPTRVKHHAALGDRMIRIECQCMSMYVNVCQCMSMSFPFISHYIPTMVGFVPPLWRVIPQLFPEKNLQNHLQFWGNFPQMTINSAANFPMEKP